MCLQVATADAPGSRTSRITSFVILNLFADIGKGTEIPHFYQGQCKFNDPKLLIGGLKGDQSLVIRQPVESIDIPPVVRNLEDFKVFAKERNISLTNINIEELIAELEIRGCVLAGMPPTKYLPPLWIKRSVVYGYAHGLIALMTLSLFIFGNTEFAFLFIYCISKYSDHNIRKVMKSIWDKKYK